MGVQQTASRPAGPVPEWFGATPGANIRKGLSPVQWAKSAGASISYGLGTKLGLAGIGLGMYSGMSPGQVAFEASIGAAAYAGGARVGGGIGRAAVSRMGIGTFKKTAIKEGSKAGIVASRYALRAGTVIGGAAGFIAAAAITGAMYDFATSTPRKAMEYGRRLKQYETGGGFHDPFGTAYTMRQRSLREVQRSHLNARNALGNEAYYSHIR